MLSILGAVGGYWTAPEGDSIVLANAQPLQGMTADSPPAAGKDPCPGAWVRSYTGKDGRQGRVFTSTYGASEDLLDSDYRRMLVNACFWGAGMEAKITPELPIDFVGPYQPTTFRFDGHVKGVKPADLAGWEAPILPHAAAKPEPQAAAQPQTRRERRAAKAMPTDPANPDDYSRYGIYAKSAPRPAPVDPVATSSTLFLQAGDRIGLIGNTLFDREQHFGYVETLLQQGHPEHRLVVRNLSWSADAITTQPRPENFADIEQHLTHEQVDVVLAAFGFNESFAGAAGLPAFRADLSKYIQHLKTRCYNGETAPRVVLLSPIANENIANVPAADLNNANIALYVEAMRSVASQQDIGFVDLFTPTEQAMRSSGTDLTINGCHLRDAGYRLLATELFASLFGHQAPEVNEAIRQVVIDKNRQYFRRYRPLNSFYYTGGRSKTYGYLDFLPAMRNFDILVANREQRIWDLAIGKNVPAAIDDSNLPPLPETEQSRGANEWLSAADELKEFDIDPRFEVNLFAGEEEFPDIACPIQMRWDNRGRLWVSCSTTYPHVYPGQEPNDKLVVLEDTDGDGRADKSTVFAEDLHIPLSFVLGDGGVYVSEMPDLTFLKDTDGDGKADVRERLLTGFGTEDSHHSLHDFTWTPDGDLLFRESIFHHAQVETPYGPVRQQNSGWFRFDPETHRLTSFGSYPSTNPWGVTFDDWGQHVASHPIYAAAFHSLDPPYPQQHPAPKGLRAYSGTCGQEFVDFAHYPAELQGDFIKVRYKPTNRVEIHHWNESEFGFDEEYVSDLIFSKNLSFIPVDLQFGPRGALYICDWYNPVKGHAQYSLRDERRDRHSGRIWRVVPKGVELPSAPQIAAASIEELLELLKRPEYRVRYWAKRELRDRDSREIARALDRWVAALDRDDPRFRHHQLEAVWLYRGIDEVRQDLLRDLLACNDHHARAAAVEQLRFWHPHMQDAIGLLHTAANDSNGIVRMQAAIAASYIGTQPALDALLDVFKHPREGHLAYAITCALGSRTLRAHWEGNKHYNIDAVLKQANKGGGIQEPKPAAEEAAFDAQPNLLTVRIGCVPERMKFTIEQFTAQPGQPVKLAFRNPDATDHNLLIVHPGSLAEVGMAANEMAKDPKNANSDFHPADKAALIIEAAPMIGPTRKSQIHVLRFNAPAEPGLYPFVCTFPGHWVIMNGTMVVAGNDAEAQAMLAAAKPTIVREWSLADFADFELPLGEESIIRGMQAYAKANCNQCHLHAGHGVGLGPDLTKIGERFQGEMLLRQILEPSQEINKQYQTWQFITTEGQVVSGIIKEEGEREVQVMTNLLLPDQLTKLQQREIEVRRPSAVSSMPMGMVNVLTKQEVLDLVAFLQAGGYELPEHLRGKHGHPAQGEHGGAKP
ncbi:MAG: GDSL-type esterase/lipase family protein [Planctomycetaceae bacterium]